MATIDQLARGGSGMGWSMILRRSVDALDPPPREDRGERARALCKLIAREQAIRAERRYERTMQRLRRDAGTRERAANRRYANAHKITCVDAQISFRSIEEAAEWAGRSRNAIYLAIRGYPAYRSAGHIFRPFRPTDSALPIYKKGQDDNHNTDTGAGQAQDDTSGQVGEASMRAELLGFRGPAAGGVPLPATSGADNEDHDHGRIPADLSVDGAGKRGVEANTAGP